MVVGIMAVVAQAERKMISARTKAALQAAKARGVLLGGLRHRVDGSVVKLDPVAIAAGRAARTAKSAARATDLGPIIDDIKATGASSLREIAAELNGRGIPTARGGQWSAVQVQRILNRAEGAPHADNAKQWAAETGFAPGHAGNPRMIAGRYT